MQKMRTQGNGVITPAKKERKSVREVTWVKSDIDDVVDVILMTSLNKNKVTLIAKTM